MGYTHFDKPDGVSGVWVGPYGSEQQVISASGYFAGSGASAVFTSGYSANIPFTAKTITIVNGVITTIT